MSKGKVIRCQCLTASRSQCKNNSLPGSEFCYRHIDKCDATVSSLNNGKVSSPPKGPAKGPAKGTAKSPAKGRSPMSPAKKAKSPKKGSPAKGAQPKGPQPKAPAKVRAKGKPVAKIPSESKKEESVKDISVSPKKKDSPEKESPKKKDSPKKSPASPRPILKTPLSPKKSPAKLEFGTDIIHDIPNLKQIQEMEKEAKKSKDLVLKRPYLGMICSTSGTLYIGDARDFYDYYQKNNTWELFAKSIKEPYQWTDPNDPDKSGLLVKFKGMNKCLQCDTSPQKHKGIRLSTNLESTVKRPVGLEGKICLNTGILLIGDPEEFFEYFEQISEKKSIWNDFVKSLSADEYQWTGAPDVSGLIIRADKTRCYDIVVDKGMDDFVMS